MGLKKKIIIDDLKENRAVSGAREKLQDNKTQNVIRWVFEIAVTVVFAVLVAISLFQTVTIQESAMEPTLAVGEKFFVNKAVYKVSSPKRGDIIVFKTNVTDDAALHIRRVIGLPGESVLIKDGKIYINGELYEEAGDYPDISNPGLAETSISLESGEYFVLGDNRNNSEDSRYSDIGNIKKNYIVGKLWFTVSPRSKMGFMKN
nr:signal peptidase I [uncultured Blautia sp.]